MNAILLSYIMTLFLFTGIDMVWLAGPGRPIYVTEIGSLLRATPNVPAAIAFYLVYCAGLIFFAVNGAIANENATQALLHGALLGLVAYGTYDLTNLAVINGFTLKIALIDMCWGSILSGAVAWMVVRLSLLWS